MDKKHNHIIYENPHFERGYLGWFFNLAGCLSRYPHPRQGWQFANMETRSIWIYDGKDWVNTNMSATPMTRIGDPTESGSITAGYASSFYYVAQQGGKHTFTFFLGTQKRTFEAETEGSALIVINWSGTSFASDAIEFPSDEKTAALSQEIDARMPKRIVAFGDSIIGGWYRGAGYGRQFISSMNLLRDKLSGKGYEIVTLGIASENFDQIMARCGALSIISEKEIELPAERGKAISLGAGNTVWRLSNGKMLSFTIPYYEWQGRDMTAVAPTASNYEETNRYNSYNPLFVNGISCTIKTNGLSNGVHGNVTIERNESGEAVKIPAGSVFLPHGARWKMDIALFFCGTNNLGISSDYTATMRAEQFVKNTEKMISACRTEKYIVVSPYQYGYSNVENLEKVTAVEEAYLNAFGTKFLNLRKYLVDNAERILGNSMTEEDRNCVSGGYVPYSFLEDVDLIHLNEKGNKAFGTALYERMMGLGYV